MCGPLHYLFEGCEHLLDSGQLERCQNAYQNNTVCQGDAISQNSVVQHQPGLCPHCVQVQAQGGRIEESESQSEENSYSDDSNSNENEDDVTTMHRSEDARSRATTRSHEISGSEATSEVTSAIRQPSMLHPRSARSRATTRTEQNRGSSPIGAAKDSTTRLSNIYQLQYQRTPAAGFAQQYAGMPVAPHMPDPQQYASHQQYPPSAQPGIAQQRPVHQQYGTLQQFVMPHGPTQPGHEATQQHHDLQQEHVITDVDAKQSPAEPIAARRPRRRRFRETCQPPPTPKKGWSLGEKLFGWRTKAQSPIHPRQDIVREEKAHLDRLQHDKGFARARQKAQAAEDKIFRRDTRRAIAASKPSATQLKLDDEQQVRQAMLASINDYTKGLKQQIKHGKSQVKVKYTQCGHETCVDAAGFAADAGYAPNTVQQNGVCDDCYLRQHRHTPQINVEAPSSCTPEIVRGARSPQGGTKRTRIRRREQVYVPSESHSQPVEYARIPPSFASRARSVADPDAVPEVPERLPTIAGSRAPSINSVMRNGATEEAHRQRLFDQATEAGSSAISGSSKEIYHPSRAEVGTKKAGKRRAI